MEEKEVKKFEIVPQAHQLIKDDVGETQRLMREEKNEDLVSLPRKPDKEPPVDEKDFLDILKIFAPGTSIRTALDDILRAEMGALIVFDKEGLTDLMEGGFRLNCRFSPQKLVELSKMDGGIIISSDLKKILFANTLLTPSAKVITRETGTRHKAAERVARQLGTIAIAVSERRKKITLYFGDQNYYLSQTSEVLRRASETLQILEKQKEIFNDLISHLNVLEITNLTTTNDVCGVLQSLENVRRISENVRKYLIELGKEGIIVSMRLKELTRNLSKERELLLKDYFGQKHSKADELLKNLNFDFLLETSNISRILFGELHDKPISPTGLRILDKTNLLEKDVKMLLHSFGSLDKVFDADRDSLLSLFRNEDVIGSILRDIKTLKEKILVGKSI